MKTMNFSEFDRELLEDIFGLQENEELSILLEWIEKSKNYELDDYETKTIYLIQSRLKYRVDFWNEMELIENFISPLFSLINFTTKEYGLFSEREIKAVINDIELKGKPDVMIAKGRYSPKIPYFCFHEYKKEKEPNGEPQGQCLAAMVAAQELNNNSRPLYGVVVKGEKIQFLVLKGKEYAISNSYRTTDDEIFEIVKLLKHLKTIIEIYVKS